VSGIIRTQENLFGIRKRAHANSRSDQAKRMGKNRDPYYGMQAQEILDQKHGKRKFADSVLGKGNGRKSAMSASAQLLGGG
jgi:hypothetical protein